MELAEGIFLVASRFQALYLYPVEQVVFEGVSSTPSSCGMAFQLNGVDGGGDFPGRGMSAVAVTVAPPGERAILNFLLDRVSMGIAAASFAAWLCWVTPAARDDCCWGRCCGALLAAAAKVR